MPLPIEDYALIGDMHGAALVGKNGAIDWLCWPRFDSDACFAALLGDDSHGRWLLSPRCGGFGQRRYRPNSLVLETDFESSEGAVRIIDFMPPRQQPSRLIRLVQGLRGQLAMRSELTLRFGYGDRAPWLRPYQGGISALAGPDALWLEAQAPLRIEQEAITSDFVVSEGRSVVFSLQWRPSHVHEPPPRVEQPPDLLEDTDRWWRSWCGRCHYEGPYREVVQRSLITLKALTYWPTGGMAAAATTSLPERLGGVRNWDYRYCWLRDATFTLLALMNAGYMQEAQAWRDWLLRAVAGEPNELQIAYGLSGEKRMTEVTLPWLPGYEGAGPVRIGNAAAGQLQLDVFGEVFDCLHQARVHGLAPAPDFWPVQRALLEFLERSWDKPDQGIWEVRGPAQHFTHSKVMAWVAVDRTLRDATRLGFETPRGRWRALRERIHDEVCRRGFDLEQSSFVQSYGSKALDASLLMMPLVGFLPVEDMRVQGTIAAIQARLMHDGLVFRYDSGTVSDGLPPGEGAFLACSLWLADTLILQGRRREATSLFERVLELRNDVGPLSEQYDPVARRLVGNFPQAFSHVALTNTALNLSRPAAAEQRRAD